MEYGRIRRRTTVYELYQDKGKGKDKDKGKGNYYVSFHYEDWTGKNVRKLKRGFATKKEATEWERHFKEELAGDLDMTFENFYHQYEEDKKYIPEGNLIEVKFEDFEADAMGMTERIYRELSLPGFDEACPAIEQYVGKKRGYRKNKYNYPQELIDLVNAHWGQAIDDFGYERL